MPFDVEAAKAAGYSDAEIADYLGQDSGFDSAAARQAGYSDAEILGHLTAQPATPPRSIGQEFGRQLGLTARAGAETVAGVAAPFIEAAAGLANLGINAMGGKGDLTFMPALQRSMDAVFPKRETDLERGVGIASSMLLGAKMPTPQIGAQAPAGFQTTKEVAAATMANRVKDAQAAGYVVPPVTSNPTMLNKVAEGTAGKLTTAQLASVKNQGTTTRLASQAIGLNPETPLTLGAVQAVRKEAGQAYEAIRGAGTVQMDKKLWEALNSAENVFKGANRSFPGLANNPAAERIAALRQNQFDAGDAVDAISVLREYADTAGKQGDKLIAKTYRNLATALEDSIGRHLEASGNAAAVDAFRSARTLIAKTYSVEKAINPVTGEVSATVLARELAKGKPMSGPLRKAAEFGMAFPKAARSFNESMPGMSPLDMYAAGGAAGVSNSPSLLTLPFVRQGVRNALLTPLGQRLAVPSVGGPLRPEVANALAVGGGLIGQQ